MKFESCVMGLLVIVSASGATSAEQDVKAQMKAVMHSWDALNPVEAAPNYAKDPGLIFYDISPLKYTGWNEYFRGIKKEFAGYKSYKTTLAPDLDAHLVGENFAWGTSTWRADAVKDDKSTEIIYGRWTVLFEKRVGKWLIIHEHVSLSVPSTPPPPPAKK